MNLAHNKCTKCGHEWRALPGPEIKCTMGCKTEFEYDIDSSYKKPHVYVIWLNYEEMMGDKNKEALSSDNPYANI